MKGVIVQIGEPKSIVLYNSGKIGAIPTPADCHVGMVVSVQYNNRLKILLFILAAVLLVGAGVFIGTRLAGGRTGSRPSAVFPLPQNTEQERGRIRDDRLQSVNAAQAKNLADDTRVTLTGNIVNSLGDEKYLFRDSSGDITVDIDRKLWRGLSVDASATVEIDGEVDIEKGQTVIDVKSIRKK